MNTLKYRNMMKAYTGFGGEQTVRAVKDQIPAELFDALTGKQLGTLMSLIYSSYQRGRKEKSE